jgi:membrane protease YdiL (CAAX protease family)
MTHELRGDQTFSSTGRGEILCLTHQEQLHTLSYIVSTNEPAPPEKVLIEALRGVAGPPLPHDAFEAINPDNPPWGISHAVLVWVISVALLFFVPLLAVIPYVLYKIMAQGSAQAVGVDSNLIFISILAVLPTHVLTFLVVWFVVTSKGRHPFWQTLGWRWPENFGPAKTIGLAILLLAVGVGITHFLGGSETQLEQLINSSLKARFATAFLAAVTGPLVEELVYRGVLYSAFQKALGVSWAIVIVSALFAGVHVLQYFNNLGVIAVITLLSVCLTVVRARSGSLLPSYVIHLVFNGIQAVILVVQPFVGKPAIETPPPIGFLIHSLARLLT